jgi:hypothetical protein
MCGGMQDRFDLIIPPGKIANILTVIFQINGQHEPVSKPIKSNIVDGQAERT